MIEDIRIIKKPRLRKPVLVVAWPGMGDVAFKVAHYLIDKLKAEECAEILPEKFFYLTGSIIQNGIVGMPELPYSKFYFWKNKDSKEDLLIFISNAQPDLSRAEDYCQRIIALAKAFKVKTIASFASMPQPIDHTQDPGVWLAATNKETVATFKNLNINILKEGQISGMNGLFLGRAKREGFNGYCLLGEVPLYTIQIENPKASAAVLGVFSRIMNIKIDLGDLIAQSHTIETEINKLLDYLKIGPQAPGPIGEEEIEKIKKTLSELSRLPLSVKERIEQLFKEASLDIAKASELKVELDRWNAYKEYEDRFLDLFKKKKDNTLQ